MANENNDISDIVKKCKILLLDIEGTTTSVSFVKDKLFPYAEKNVKAFLENQWEQENVKEIVTDLRKLALEDKEKSVEGVVTIPGEEASKEDQIEGLVNNVKWLMSADRKIGPLKLLQGLIWKQGYDNGEIKGHVYDDVTPALEHWRSVDGQKVYIYSSGSVQAQKLLFGQSSAGDLLPLIDGHFDTAVGAKQEATSYATIAEKIGCKPEDILFLTDISKEAEAARSSGVRVALVSREGNTPLSTEATASFPILHSFVQLTNTNKRKPDTQDEQPTKLPKTEIDKPVKDSEISSEDIEASEKIIDVPIENTQVSIENSEASKKVIDGSEKMEIDEEQVNSKKLDTEVPVHQEVVIEELPENNAQLEIPIVEAEPIISNIDTENNDKKSEIMDIDSSVITENIKKGSEQAVDEKGLVIESLPAMVTEIEEISADKEALNEMTEIIDDLNPVIEEPETIEDMEDLKNVGEVLEKECDEILSKVQDVTNLDNIPVKPLLNPIAEETMEVENIDSNDIMDRILDKEMEMESKSCQDDMNTDQEVSNENIGVEMKGNDANKDELPVDVPEKAINKDEIQEKFEESSKQAIVEKKVENKKEIKMETVYCQTETKTETVAIQTSNMDVEFEENKVEAKDNKTETVSVEKDSREINIPKHVLKTEECKGQEESDPIKGNVLSVDDNKVREDNVSCKKADNDVKEKLDEKVEISTISIESTTSSENVTKINTEVSTEPSSEQVNLDNDVKDTQVNGNTTNGESDVKDLNGDASKDDELSSRLSVENGNDTVNGSKIDPTKEQGQGDNKTEPEVTDIKVKSVSAEDPPKDPVDQPTA